MPDEGTKIEDTPVVTEATTDVTPDATEAAPETPATDAGETPVVTETAEEKAERLEAELAALKGEVESIKSKATPGKAEEPSPEEKKIAEIDGELADIEKQLGSEDLAPNAYNEDREAEAEKREKRLDLKEKRRDLLDERRKADEAKGQRKSDLAAREGTVKEIMAAPDVKLPPSAFNELRRRVDERLAREGFAGNKQPSKVHYAAAVEAEALKLKATFKPKSAGAAPPKPNAGKGGSGDTPFHGVKPGKKADVIRQYRELGIT